MHEQLRIDDRGPTPDEQAWIRETRPVMTPQIAILADAFCDLRTECAIGMAVGPIPASAIRAWARDHELDYDATLVLKRVIRVVEHEMKPAAPAGS